MADPQRSHEDDVFERGAAAPRASAFGRDDEPTQSVRPRIGRGPARVQQRAAARIDSQVALRAIGVSGAVAVLVLGGFFLLQSLGIWRTEEMALEHSRLPQPTVKAAAGGLVPTTAPAAAPAPPEVPNEAERVAALLSHEPAPQAPAQATPPASAPASAAPRTPGAPTAADFARPAFLEPLEADDTANEPAAAKDGTQDGGEARSDPAGERQGRINTAINLRSGPQRGAPVLATLEAGTKVTIYSCKSWCEVAADGKRGYVYRRAVDQ